MACLAIALMCVWVSTSIDLRMQRARGARLMLLTPMTAILFLSIGSYDPYTVIGFALGLFAWRRNSLPLMTLAGAYMGFQHFEQSLVAVTAVGLLTTGLAGGFPPSCGARAMWRGCFPAYFSARPC